MEVATGIVFSLIFLSTVMIAAHLFRPIFWPIVLGGAARLTCAWLIYAGVVAPPGTQADAVAFERRARIWSELDWVALLAEFDPGGSRAVAWQGAVIYKVFGQSAIMLNVINAWVSVLLIVLTYRLAVRLIGPERAKISAWIAAMFPFAILYGSIYRREVFGAAALTIGLLYVVKWRQKDSLTAVVKAVVAFSVAALFHGAYSVAILALGILALWDAARQLTRPSHAGGARIFATGAIGGMLVMLAVVHATTSELRLGSFGHVNERLMSPDEAVEYRTLTRVSDGGSSYPSVLTGEEPFKRPWVIPGRIAYFLFSPFPWDIRGPMHLLGGFASVVFAYIGASIWRSRRYIRSRRDVSAVFAILAVLIFVFGVSIDNVGTSIRHRTKFVFALLALCHSPLFRLSRRPRARRMARIPAGHLMEPPAFNPAVQRSGLR